jgi:lipoprotein-releasing system permease protein
MFSAFEWMVAARYLRSRRREGLISVIAWFSLLGIMLGVATLIIVMSVMNGFRHELLGRILGLNGHLSVYATQGFLTDHAGAINRLKSLDGVVSLVPIVEGQVMATAQGVAQGALVRGIAQADLAGRKLVADNIDQGSLDDFTGDNAIVLGSRMAQRLNVGIGEQVTLISPKGNITAFGSVPRLRSYRVVATFQVGMYEYDSGFAFLPLEAAQTFFQTGVAVTNLEILTRSPDDAVQIGQNVRIALGPDFRVHDWQQANSSFFTAIQVERNVMFLILTLIILVAAFNIISSLIMLVKDKGRDIAILRTMGATRGMVMRVFFICGASIGIIGTLAGLLLGVAFAVNIETIREMLQGITGTELFAAEIYFLSHLPAQVDADEVIAIVCMGLGLSLLATLYPSWRAARIDPAEALRYE